MNELCRRCRHGFICPAQNPEVMECTAYKLRGKTNADRVRTMTDEKLATWLGDMLGVYPFGTDQWDRQAWLDWLKEEVKA